MRAFVLSICVVVWMHVGFENDHLGPRLTSEQVKSHAGGCDGSSGMQGGKQETLHRELLSHGARQSEFAARG
jgi:hypothetical protein